MFNLSLQDLNSWRRAFTTPPISWKPKKEKEILQYLYYTHMFTEITPSVIFLRNILAGLHPKLNDINKK